MALWWEDNVCLVLVSKELVLLGEYKEEPVETGVIMMLYLEENVLGIVVDVE